MENESIQIIKIRKLERISEISRELSSGLTLDPLLRKIIFTAADLTNCERASILLYDPKKDELRFRSATGDLDGVLLDIPVPIEGSLAGVILKSKEPLIVTDVRDDLRYYKEVDTQSGFQSRSLLGVPLLIKDRCIGALEVVNKIDQSEFNPEDVSTLQALAAHAAIAIENAQLYEEVVRNVDQLEERVEERTGELKKQNDELAAYDQTVAHDLKNPLALVIGYAEILVEDFPTMQDEEMRRYLKTIAQSGLKMRSIIDELLLLSGVRSMDVKLSLLDMSGIINEVQQRLILMIDKHQAEIIMPDYWPEAYGYGPWVEEVWANYISNAIKYGGRPPRIELGGRKQESGDVCFWVRDNGVGIPPEKQKGLFTRFTRLDQYRAKGHGLGLSIVKRIVNKLGGDIGLTSEEGKGTKFTFTLPGINT